jgi:hypothetical protein
MPDAQRNHGMAKGMVLKRNRREFLGLLGGAAVGAAALAGRPGALRAQAQPSLAIRELRGGLHLISGGGGNVVASAYDGALLLVDSGSPESAASLRALLDERFAAAPVGLLFNTHWHLDHTGGNEALVGQRAATIIAHENTRLWMSTEFDVEWEGKHYERFSRRTSNRSVSSSAARRSATATCSRRTRTATSTCDFPSATSSSPAAR